MIFLAAPLTVRAQGYIGYETPTGDVARFSADVTALTMDWAATPWQRGRILIHPMRYKQTANVSFMRLLAAELPAKRTAQTVLEFYYDGMVFGRLNDLKADMAGAKSIAPGILVKIENWTHGFGGKTTFWGVITMADGNFVPFDAECANEEHNYTHETCVRAIFTTAVSIQTGTLKMPQTEAPLYVPGWNGTYDVKGETRLSHHDIRGAGAFGGPDNSTYAFVSAKSSYINASAPRILIGEMRTEILKFADTVTNFDFGGTPESVRWNGGVYIRVFSGITGVGKPHQFITARKMPDGRHVLISVGCYSENYFTLCTQAMERVIGDVESGMMATRIAERTKPVQ